MVKEKILNIKYLLHELFVCKILGVIAICCYL